MSASARLTASRWCGARSGIAVHAEALAKKLRESRVLGGRDAVKRRNGEIDFVRGASWISRRAAGRTQQTRPRIAPRQYRWQRKARDGPAEVAEVEILGAFGDGG